MEFLNALFTGTLDWRNATWLWALLVPVMLWVFKKLGQKQQQQAYADTHLWPWVSGSNNSKGSKQTVFQPKKAQKTDSDILNAAPRPISKLLSHIKSSIHSIWVYISTPSRLMAVAWFCLVIALAGPRSQINAPDIESREGVDILVSMDLSHSMSAKDVYPSRFLFAQSLVESMSKQLETSDRLALQAYAGQAHMVSPLSYDRNLFQHALNLLEPNLLPLQGSWLDLAVIGGLTHLSQTAGKAKVMVIFTNGAPEFWKPVELPENLQNSPFAKAKRLSQTGVKVVIVGVGLPIASSLEDKEHSTGHLHANGLLVKSRLEESQLKKVAQSLEGVYLRAETGQDFQNRLLQEITLPAGSRSESQANFIWQDFAQLFMVMGLILLLLAFYLLGLLQINFRGRSSNLNSALSLSAGLLILTVYSFPQPAQAATLEAQKTTQTHQQAFEAYQTGNFELSQSLYDQITTYQGWFGAGSAAYKAGDIESAVLYFRQAAWSADNDNARATALFNLGNSYYQANLLAQAIESYQQALVYRPVYENASHNLKLTLQRKAIEDRGKTDKDDQTGEDDGSKSRDSDGAFYGGQKPTASDSKEAGFGSDGDAPEGDRSGKGQILPQAGDDTDYRLSTSGQQLKFTTFGGQSEQANAILIQQQRVQRAQAFEHELQQLEDDQKTLLRRLFEREAGFHAPQEKAHPIPGVQPW